MAVYTDVQAEALKAFLASYDLGPLVSFKGIAQGVENSNFLVQCEKGLFILTLYEKRVEQQDLPFFIHVMDHLAQQGLTCPQPIKNRTGQVLGTLSERPACLVSFLKGTEAHDLLPFHCEAAGNILAQIHLLGKNFPFQRKNPLSLEGWNHLAQLINTFPRLEASLPLPSLQTLITDELLFLQKAWPEKGLPQGLIHADLFPDNVLFLKNSLSGVLDFYFSCTDFLAYDVAIGLNAWCFEPDGSFNLLKGKAFLNAYHKERPLTPLEVQVLPLLARGAALRFLLTRSFDWLHTSPDALVHRKDPKEYFDKLRFHQKAPTSLSYGFSL